jgi:hypothetical protein
MASTRRQVPAPAATADVQLSCDCPSIGPTAGPGQVPTGVIGEIHPALVVRLTYDPSATAVDAEVRPPHEIRGNTSVRGSTWYVAQRIGSRVGQRMALVMTP